MEKGAVVTTAYIQSFPEQLLNRQRIARAEQAQAYQSLYMAGSVCLFLHQAASSEKRRGSARVARDAVLKLTEQIGLSISTAAQVLGVTRATLYSWLKLEREPQPTQAARIEQILRALVQLERYVETGNPLHCSAVLPNGLSLLTLLKADVIDHAAIADSLQALAVEPPVKVADITDEELAAEPNPPKALVDLFRDANKWANE